MSQVRTLKQSSQKKVLLKLEHNFIHIMCDINPKYKKHLTLENRKNKKVKVSYLRVLRALYGALESALLWYELYRNTLRKFGFVLNPYHKCIANKIMENNVP
mgnify:CR=1 FL=1